MVLLMFYLVLKILENPINLILTGKKTIGTVVAFQKDTSLVSPVVQFTDILGKYVKVSGRTYSKSAGVEIGDEVLLFYDIRNPKDAQLLMWREFYIIGFLIGFIAFIVLLWISCFLIAPQSGFDDPLNILSSVIGFYHSDPWRIPLYFILFCTIFFTGSGTYITLKNGISLRTNGIKVIGLVEDTQWSEKRIESDNEYEPAEFVMISYNVAGKTYTVPRSVTKPFTQLQKGDSVELIYPLNQPNLAVVNTWDEVYLVSFVLSLFFIAFTSLLLLLWTGQIKLPLTQS